MENAIRKQESFVIFTLHLNLPTTSPEILTILFQDVADIYRELKATLFTRLRSKIKIKRKVTSMGALRVYKPRAVPSGGKTFLKLAIQS